jgi:Fe-S-cluster containining protein
MLLSQKDIERIMKLGYDKKFFMLHKNRWLQLKNNKGRCVFHTGEHCRIYNDRPEGCTIYPLVYDKNHREVILDSECPCRNTFSLSKPAIQQLLKLILILKQERKQRKKKTSSSLPS